MSIQPPFASRFMRALGGSFVVAIWLWLIWYSITVRHENPITTATLGGPFVAIFGFIAYWGARRPGFARMRTRWAFTRRSGRPGLSRARSWLRSYAWGKQEARKRFSFEQKMTGCFSQRVRASNGPTSSSSRNISASACGGSEYHCLAQAIGLSGVSRGGPGCRGCFSYSAWGH